MFGDETWHRTPQHALFSLESHPGATEPGKLWSLLLCALCHVRTLQLGGYFGPEKVGGKLPAKLTEQEVEVGSWVVHLLQLASYNMQKLTTGSEQDRSIGQGLYTTASLINHSCDSNVTRYFTGARQVVVASRDIQEGEEVTDCYLPRDLEGLDRAKRRAWLHHYYRFLCECPVCIVEEVTNQGGVKPKEETNEEGVKPKEKTNQEVVKHKEETNEGGVKHKEETN